VPFGNSLLKNRRLGRKFFEQNLGSVKKKEKTVTTKLISKFLLISNAFGRFFLFNCLNGKHWIFFGRRNLLIKKSSDLRIKNAKKLSFNSVKTLKWPLPVNIILYSNLNARRILTILGNNCFLFQVFKRAI
jgi:hypothetical protein